MQRLDIYYAKRAIKENQKRKIMEATTDYISWLYGCDLENHEEIYSLYKSIEDCCEWGSIKTQLARGSGSRWIVTADYVDQPLLLASEKAKDAFLKHITKSFCGDMEMEGWYVCNHAMEKDD
jgi:hypothetical protein